MAMAGREKKPLSNKQLGVRKESDKVIKVTEAAKEEDPSNKTRDFKQFQKDVNQGKKCILKKRSTGGIKSRKNLESTEVTVKDGASSSVDSATGGKPARISQNQKLRQTNKLSKAVISQSGTNLVNELLCHSSDTKRSQSLRLCKTNKVLKAGKQGSRILEETNLSGDSNLNTLTTKAQSPKLRKFATQNKVGTGSPDVRNGTKGRNTPYITRSESPARVLRNGKRRKLKDPSLLEGLDVGYPKRRRLLSTTRDGSSSELGIKNEPCLDDQSSIAGSDSSVYDFSRLENGKGNWDSDCDSKVPVDDTKNEEHSAHDAFSSCSENQSQTSHESCLGASISNKIAELMHRNKLVESSGKELVPKEEEKLVSNKVAESNEPGLEKCIENEKNLMDTNFNLCGPGSVHSEKTNCMSLEHKLSHDCSTHIISSESEGSEIKEKVEHVLPTPRKVTMQDNADLKELGHKNGQNLSVDVPVYHPREKSVRKVRDIKTMRSKKFFQECPSSSGVFYVVQNPLNILLQKEGARSVLTPSSGEHQSSLTCTDAELANVDARVQNSSVEEKQSSDIENVSSAEGGISSVCVKDIVRDTSDVCAGLEIEKESTHVLPQTLMCEADVSCLKNDSVTDITVTGQDGCVHDINVDGKGCNSIDSERECNNKIDFGIKDDGSAEILDRKAHCENDIKIVSKKPEKMTCMDCENTVTHDVVTDIYDGNRVADNNDSFSTDSGAVDCMKTVSKDDSVMDTDIKRDCKETVCDTDMKIGCNETVDPTSGTNFKELYSVDDGSDCSSMTNKPQISNVFEIPDTTNSVKSALETDDCESGTSEGSKNVRRSTRSSVGKVRAAMLHCMTAGRTKSSQPDLQEKSQEGVKIEVESLPIGLTENTNTVVSEDVIFSTRKTSEFKGKQNDIEEKDVKINELERKTDPLFAEENISYMARELLLHTNTTVMTAQIVPSKHNLFHKHDIQIKEGAEDSSEEKGNSLCVDGIVAGKECGTSEAPLGVEMFKESIDIEKTKEQEILSDEDNKKGISQPKIDTSVVTDFINPGSEKVIDNEGSNVLEPIAEASKVPHNTESYCKQNNWSDSKLPVQSISLSNIVTHLKVDAEHEEEGDDKKNEMDNLDGVLIPKLQSDIEPTTFYAEEDVKDVASHDSKPKASDIIKGMESNLSEIHYDCKEQVSICTKEKFPSVMSGTSNEFGQTSDNKEHVTEEIIHTVVTVKQCDKVSEDGAVGIMSHMKEFEVDEALPKASSSIAGVSTSSKNADGNNSKVTDSKSKFVGEEVSLEEQAIKESVLSALGLQPLRVTQAGIAASGSHNKLSEGYYTGTLKTVIKLQRSSPEKRRTPLKLVLKNGKAHTNVDEAPTEKEENDFENLVFDGHEKLEYSVCKETGASVNTKDPFAFGIGSRKCLKSAYSYRYFDVSNSPQFIVDKSSSADPVSPEISSKDDGKAQSSKQSGNLVIPEKSASFSIHPGRLCSDVCSYCFGKFGSLDTPCHIAQLKSSERQQKVLQAETHLTADSCLCDACYRHVDRKANCPSYKPNKKRQHHRSGSSQIKSLCCVHGCSQIAEHQVRRKWLIKLKRSIAKKVRIDMDKMPQHLPFPMCIKHYSWIDYFMVCGICKRRLTRNQMYPLGSDVHELNAALASDGIPVHLSDKLFVCKLCRYFSSVRLKYKDPSQLAGNHKLFFQGYRKRLLHFHDIEEMDEETAEQVPPKPRRRKTKSSTSVTVKVDGEDGNGTMSKCEPTSQSEEQRLTDGFGPATVEFGGLGDVAVDRSGASTPMIDYSSLGNGTSNSNLFSFEDIGSSHKQTLKLERVKPTKLKLKLGSGKIGSLSYNQSEGQNSRSILLPERDGLEVTPIHDSLSQSFYPGEEELPLHADFEFHVKKEAETSNNRRGEWDKCTATIQFDKDTKSLFQQLQRPYGNHSSFFRHLILLEKYWRSGELILAANASSRAVNYVNSVQNRIHAYEGHPSSTFAHHTSSFSSLPHFSSAPSATPVPVIDLPLKRRPGSGILTAADGSSRPVTITRMSGISILPQPVTFTSVSSAVGSSSQSHMPVFTSFPQNSPSPAPQKVIMDAVATSAVSHFQQSKRVPNVLQVTAGGKSFSIIPGLTQIRHIQAIQQQRQFQRQQQQQQQQQGSTCFEPMICDVRSLATGNGSGLWDQNVTQRSGSSKHQANVSVSVLPKTNTSTAFKRSTIVTPTGIILSRKPDISFAAVTEKKKNVTFKAKSVSSKRESVSKVKPISEKLDLMKAKAVLEKKDTVLQVGVLERKDGLPQTNC